MKEIKIEDLVELLVKNILEQNIITTDLLEQTKKVIRKNLIEKLGDGKKIAYGINDANKNILNNLEDK